MIQKQDIDCIVEYCGVYPIGWNLDDIIEYECMENNGEIVIITYWIKNKEHIPNN